MLNLLLPATLGQAKIDRAYMGIHLYIFVKNTQNIDFQNSPGPPLIIQHSVAIENMHVYICMPTYAQSPFASHPVASKNRYSIYGHTSVHVCYNPANH